MTAELKKPNFVWTMTGKITKKSKNQKTNKNHKIKKRYEVGEPCVAFLQKMPKCKQNKNQKIIKIMYIFFMSCKKLEDHFCM